MSTTKQPTLQDRLKKLRELQGRLNKSSEDNKKDVFEEHQRKQSQAQNQVRLARKRVEAEKLKSEQDAIKDGVDPERRAAWGYSIEENEQWERKLKEKSEKSNIGFTDYTQMAHKKYNRLMNSLKPDLDSYIKDKAEKLTLAGATLIVDNEGQLIRAEDTHGDFYKDANSTDYAAFSSTKPSDEALERLSKDIKREEEIRAKRSRKRPDNDMDELSHINERNRVFNRKLERFYGDHVTEIKQSLERGTML